MDYNAIFEELRDFKGEVTEEEFPLVFTIGSKFIPDIGHPYFKDDLNCPDKIEYRAFAGKLLYKMSPSCVEKDWDEDREVLSWTVLFDGSVWTVDWLEPYIWVNPATHTALVLTGDHDSIWLSPVHFRIDEVDMVKEIYPDLWSGVDTLDSIHVYRPDLLGLLDYQI